VGVEFGVDLCVEEIVVGEDEVGEKDGWQPENK
jgi:hypothetical protein